MATASLTVSAETGQGVRQYVAAALQVLDELGIRYELNAMATNIEGDVETICKAVSTIHARCHEIGAVRVGTLLRIDDRIDTEQTLESKVQHVRELRDR
ncbi:MAG: MTH1187 family thiamine-binding protein [Candidatus Eremiobacteraeota bacterium]|nr:MTH1187 family thiamine-binding protein [Candidatus Eremiobacteraeota bacterium]